MGSRNTVQISEDDENGKKSMTGRKTIKMYLFKRKMGGMAASAACLMKQIQDVVPTPTGRMA